MSLIEDFMIAAVLTTCVVLSVYCVTEKTKIDLEREHQAYQTVLLRVIER